MIWSVIWYWLLGIFTAADIITTKIALSYNGLYEGNPLMAPFTDHIIEMKILVLLFSIAAIWLMEKISKGDGWVPVSLGTTFTSVVVVSNIAKVSAFI